MFSGAELERLRAKKQLLVMQDDLGRKALVAEARRLRSPGLWLSGAGEVVRKHPLVTAALGVAAGVVVIQALRQPGAGKRWLEALGGALPALLAAWSLTGRK